MGALDGTKIKAVAALAANRTAATIEKAVATMLAEVRRVDEAEARVDETNREALPKVVRDRTSRPARRCECQKRLTPAATDATAKANVTDPENRIMQTPRGYVQDSNAPAVVTAGQILIAASVTQEANDVTQLHPWLTQTQENLHLLERPQAIRTALAEAGYCSETHLVEAKPALLIAPHKDWKQCQARRAPPGARGRMPRQLGHRDRMARTLLTQRGRPPVQEARPARGARVRSDQGRAREGLRHATGPPSR